MNAIKTNPAGSGNSLRKHPSLADLFVRAEGRHLTADELATFRRIVPEYSLRADAAQEIAAVEKAVVDKTTAELMSLYAFSPQFPMAQAKTQRDVSIVSAYLTLAMLINDPEWLRDKLLLWLKTILQSFNFPRRESAQKKTLFGAKATGNPVEAMPQHKQAIFEAYTLLRRNYQAQLQPAHFALIDPYIQQTIETLSAD